MTQPVSKTERTERARSPRWWSRLLSRRLQFALDLAVLAAAFCLSYLLRFDFRIPETNLLRGITQLPLVVLVQFTMLLIAGVYSFVWRYVGVAESGAFVKAALWSFLPLILMRFGLPDDFHRWRVPTSILMMSTVLGFGGVLALRVLRRTIHERFEKRSGSPRGGRRKAVLLVGAGEAGVMVAKEIQRRTDSGLELMGFVDDDRYKHALVIQGIQVLGGTLDLPHLTKKLKIDEVVITIAATSRRSVRRIVEICERIPIKVRIIPGLYEILEGRVSVSAIRDVDIEDLLGREQVQLDEHEVQEFLAGKTVAVTGAGGSIGSELARQVARFLPERLLLLERAEFALFDVERELRRLYPSLELVPIVADVGDAQRIRSVLSTHRPDVILHAAAHKHVTMMELHPTEAIKNNALATNTLGVLAGELGVSTFVLVSTDKAVRPTSIMGASKRMAELIVQDLGRRFPTRYVAVRFGNVMGSAGSVIPIFREQIERGEPVTVTHPQVRRYFMTIPKAAQLVLQAGAMGEGGEIFILDMGESVRILDLARDMILLSGLKPFEDVEIVFTGLRPGEKLHEELQLSSELVSMTRHPKIRIGKIGPYPEDVVQSALRRLEQYSFEEKDSAIRLVLSDVLPEARLVSPPFGESRSDSVPLGSRSLAVGK